MLVPMALSPTGSGDLKPLVMTAILTFLDLTMSMIFFNWSLLVYALLEVVGSSESSIGGIRGPDLVAIMLMS